MPFEIIRNDITKMQVDAIVSIADINSVIGVSTESEIHAKAGPMLRLARQLTGRIKVGKARMTTAFRLPAKYIIHTVAPIWIDGEHKEAYQLKQCYNSSLTLALQHKCETIALPLISKEDHGFPSQLAFQIAVGAIREFLLEHEMLVYLVVLEEDATALSEQQIEIVQMYIDAAAYQNYREEYGLTVRRDRETTQSRFTEQEVSTLAIPFDKIKLHDDIQLRPYPSAESRSGSASNTYHARILFPGTARPSYWTDTEELSSMLQETDTGFSETLLNLIDLSGRKDSDVYKRANVNRRLFSKIRNNPQYKPSKETALAFAIALELDLEETKDFIGRAGYALSRSSKFDIIIEYFITHRRYDIYEINLMLFEFHQGHLGE